jgi:hypothetical protein
LSRKVSVIPGCAGIGIQSHEIGSLIGLDPAMWSDLVLGFLEVMDQESDALAQSAWSSAWQDVPHEFWQELMIRTTGQRDIRRMRIEIVTVSENRLLWTISADSTVPVHRPVWRWFGRRPAG